MLRHIVVREREEEARRDQAKKLMLAEFDKLKIKSDTLNEQIELLAQPVAKLTDEELALLKEPDISISDSNPAALKASFTFAKKSTNSVHVTGPVNEAAPMAKANMTTADGMVKANQAARPPNSPLPRRMPREKPTWLEAGPGKNWQSATKSA